MNQLVIVRAFGEQGGAAFRKFARAGLVLLTVAMVSFGAANGAKAETYNVRIATQPGIPYLPLILMQQFSLVEKHASELGLDKLTVTWNRYGSGAAMNDALLSGSLDFAALGTPPAILMWDRTRGSANVKGVAGFSALSQKLVTNNPSIKSLKDFKDSDRIALPAVKVSVQAILLQMAAAKLWGDQHFDRLDKLTVSMAHPDSMVALLSGKSQITAHYSSPPFQNQELASEKVYLVSDAFKDSLSGPASNGVIIATSAFISANPKTAQAFLRALDEASEIIAKEPEKAVEGFIAGTGTKLPKELLLEILAEDGTSFTATPLNTMEFATFMHARGTIRAKPENWKDLFFEVIHDRKGS